MEYVQSMMAAFRLPALFCLVTYGWFARAVATGQGSCHYPRMSCGDDVCVPPGKICDGTPECVGDFDEQQGICNHYGICHGRCMREAKGPTDRWTFASCSVCCAADLNGDDFLTLEEMLGLRTVVCGVDDEDCTGEVLTTFATRNDIPFCDGEAAARISYYASLVDDLGPDTLSKEDIAQLWAEVTEGANPPDGKIPISQCFNFNDNTVQTHYGDIRQHAYDESCEMSVTHPGAGLKFESP